MIVDIEMDGKPFQVDCNYTPITKGSCDRDGLQLEPDNDAELEILAIRDAWACSLSAPRPTNGLRTVDHEATSFGVVPRRTGREGQRNMYGNKLDRNTLLSTLLSTLPTLLLALVVAPATTHALSFTDVIVESEVRRAWRWTPED